MELLKFLPFDVIFHHIIPKTYMVQSEELMLDVRNYYMIKQELTNKEKYRVDDVQYELVKTFKISDSFNITLGALTPMQRQEFLEYHITYDGFFVTIL